MTDPSAPRLEREVSTIDDLPDDVDTLKQPVMQLLASNAKLNERLAYLLRRRYGPQSDKMDRAQLELFSKDLDPVPLQDLLPPRVERSLAEAVLPAERPARQPAGPKSSSILPSAV